MVCRMSLSNAAVPRVEWVSPVLTFKAHPECVDTEHAQIGDEKDSELADAFVAQCEGKVMAIDQMVPAVGAQNHGNAELFR